MATRIQIRRDTTANWTAENPILMEGEIGFDTTNKTFRIGDGTTAYLSLPSSGSGAYGFDLWIDSTTPPTTTNTLGQPYVWIKDESTLTAVPTTPTAPTFNYTTFDVTVPAVTGVEYQYQSPVSLAWVPLTTGTTSLSGFPRPTVINVRAVEKPGYVLTASYAWSALFYDAASLVLAASESFNRTAGTILAPTQGVAGLAFDMAGGGSETPIPNWWQYHAAGNDFGIQTGGTQVGRYPAASGNSALWFTSPANFAVEIEVNGWIANHSRSWSLYVAAPASGSYGTAQPAVTFNTPSANSQTINFAPATGMTGTTTSTHIASGALTTEAQLLGTYRISWVNKYLQVTMPNGTIYGRDYSAMTYVPTTWSYLRAAESDATVIKFNTFRIYK